MEIIDIIKKGGFEHGKIHKDISVMSKELIVTTFYICEGIRDVSFSPVKKGEILLVVHGQGTIKVDSTVQRIGPGFLIHLENVSSYELISSSEPMVIVTVIPNPGGVEPGCSEYKDGPFGPRSHPGKVDRA